MNASEIVKEKLKISLDEAEKLPKLAMDDEDILKFGVAYQHWYSQAYKLVESLAPERLEEFVSYYLIDSKRKIVGVGNYVIQELKPNQYHSLAFRHVRYLRTWDDRK